MKKQNMLDSVILVDDSDHPIGTMDKYEAHRHGATLHRAISVYLFRKIILGDTVSWQLLLQQRSEQKIVGGGMWANTVCGNVRPGESYRECAYRRLKQELGFQFSQIEAAQLEEIYKFKYFAQCNEEYSEREMDQIFIGILDVQPNNQADVSDSFSLPLNPAEVQKTCWVDFIQLTSAAANDSELALAIQQSIGKQDANVSVAPWFSLMMQHQDIQKTIKNYLAN